MAKPHEVGSIPAPRQIEDKGIRQAQEMRKHLKKFGCAFLLAPRPFEQARWLLAAVSVFWFSLTALRLFSSSPLTIVRKRPLDSLAASVVHNRAAFRVQRPLAGYAEVARGKQA
ncbi:hypothetical protein, partial [uncultured Rikenella sp.]|uniref:hypothetical protein n=1 Tax=uncultured Rikenella sp. TaxID=368003 RepID=UPI00260F713D